MRLHGRSESADTSAQSCIHTGEFNTLITTTCVLTTAAAEKYPFPEHARRSRVSCFKYVSNVIDFGTPGAGTQMLRKEEEIRNGPAAVPRIALVHRIAARPIAPFVNTCCGCQMRNDRRTDGRSRGQVCALTTVWHWRHPATGSAVTQTGATRERNMIEMKRHACKSAASSESSLLDTACGSRSRSLSCERIDRAAGLGRLSAFSLISSNTRRAQHAHIIRRFCSLGARREIYNLNLMRRARSSGHVFAGKRRVLHRLAAADEQPTSLLSAKGNASVETAAAAAT